jgi:hypothetical protein
MKSYVVGIVSHFDYNFRLFKVSAESPQKAMKEAMPLFENEAYRESLRKFIEDLPDNVDVIKDTLFNNYEISSEVIEIL